MSNQILSPRSDFIFKLIFGSEANADILAAFLRSILDLPESEYDTLTIIDPHLKRESSDGKMSVLDVKLRTKSGRIIDIEIEVSGIPEMRERVVYYTARMITNQISKGESYSVIKKVVSIIITDYILIDENEMYHNRYSLYDKKTSSEFTDIIEVDVLELPKLAPDGDGTELSDWMRFMKSDTEEELSMLAQRSVPLSKAVGVLLDLSADEQTRLLYEAHEKARRDEASRTRGALIKVAKAMLTNGEPIEKIMLYTGLTREEVDSLHDIMIG